MAAGNIFFNQELAPPAPMMADGRLERYFASSTHGFARFQHTGSALSGVPDVGLLVAGIGMAPATFVMPEGALAAAGYGAVGAVPVEITVARQPRSSGTNREAVPPFKGAWTTEEDEILKEMVRRYGDRRWATIAENLPGRIGKQCRERWTNHLRPDLKYVKRKVGMMMLEEDLEMAPASVVRRPRQRQRLWRGRRGKWMNKERCREGKENKKR